jgi:hypothetical protein
LGLEENDLELGENSALPRLCKYLSKLKRDLLTLERNIEGNNRAGGLTYAQSLPPQKVKASSVSGPRAR